MAVIAYAVLILCCFRTSSTRLLFRGGVWRTGALRFKNRRVWGGGDLKSVFDPFCYEDQKQDRSAENPLTKVQPIDDQDKVFERVRCRQHVNPLSSRHQNLVESPKWTGEDRIFEDPSLPLYLDLGCGSGRYLLQLAQKHTGEANFLGIEIREQLATRANYWKSEFGISNAHFIAGNINVQDAWDAILDAYPGPLVAVSALMPDPWFKKRHAKRRMFTEELVKKITRTLAPGGKVFIQSDVKPVADDMRMKLLAEPLLDDITPMSPTAGELHETKPTRIEDEDPSITELKLSWSWLMANPSGILTEREIYVLNQDDGKVWRAVFKKKTL